MLSLKIDSVVKEYKSNERAVNNISLEINPGEFVVIVGPSGCGKSTLLRMIAGLEVVTSGEIYIENRNVTKIEPGARDIAMVFQNYALYPHMTVKDNITYALKNRSVKEEEIDMRLEKAATILQLTDFLMRKPAQLSGGQRQRVAMGRAIVRNPKVFLFDEPLSNLDAKLRTQMRIEIKKLQKLLGTTLIYVTHDQIEAMTLADRLIVLNKGMIEQEGTPGELFNRPNTMFVAGFLGSPSMNFIAANSPDLSSFEFETHIDKNKTMTGIRPEHLTITENQEKNTLKVLVIATENLGSDQLIYTETSDNKNPLVFRATPLQKISSNETLFLNVNPCDIHNFCSKTGKRLN